MLSLSDEDSETFPMQSGNARKRKSSDRQGCDPVRGEIRWDRPRTPRCLVCHRSSVCICLQGGRGAAVALGAWRGSWNRPQSLEIHLHRRENGRSILWEPGPGQAQPQGRVSQSSPSWGIGVWMLWVLHPKVLA